VVKLAIRAEHKPRDPLGWHRLRKFLKALGRHYDFRNEGVWLDDDDQEPTP
jgi:hypothetical protein